MGKVKQNCPSHLQPCLPVFSKSLRTLTRALYLQDTDMEAALTMVEELYSNLNVLSTYTGAEDAIRVNSSGNTS